MLTINNKEVKFEKGVYSYFSCTCAKEDEEFWKKVLKLLNGVESVDNSSSLVYTLSHCFDATVSNLWADMWMGFTVETPTEKLHITTDQLHYGLACATLILIKMYPKILDEYDFSEELLSL